VWANWLKKAPPRSLAANKVAAGAATISFDGATFHGVPDQRYVSTCWGYYGQNVSNSTRTWAFNPTGL
jgi:hypothetical protein